MADLETTKTISIGRQGENGVLVLAFDLTDYITEYGEGTPTLLHQRSGDSRPYLCGTTFADSILSWTVTDADTHYAGTGRAEIRWTVGEQLKKSAIFYTDCTASIMDGDTEQPGEIVYMCNATEDLITVRDAALQAIDDEGAIARGSIPTEYTTLSDYAALLGSEVTGINTDGYLHLRPVFTSGGISNAGYESTSEYWVRSGYIAVTPGQTITYTGAKRDAEDVPLSIYLCTYTTNEKTGFSERLGFTSVTIPESIRYVRFTFGYGSSVRQAVPDTTLFDARLAASYMNETFETIDHVKQKFDAAFSYKEVIPAGADFDSYTSAGSYGIGNDAIAGCANAPSSYGGLLCVFDFSDTESHIYQHFADSAGYVYTRYKTAKNGWLAWQKLALDSDTGKFELAMSHLYGSADDPTWITGKTLSPAGALFDNACYIVTELLRSSDRVNIGYNLASGESMLPSYVCRYDANGAAIGQRERLDSWTAALTGSAYFRIAVKVKDSEEAEASLAPGDITLTMSGTAGSGGKWYALGDSITEGTWNSGDSTATPVSGGKYSRAYIQTAADLSGYSLMNLGEHGSGFLAKGATTGKCLQDFVDENDFTDADIVSIAYGINDYIGSKVLGTVEDAAGESTICGQLKYALKTLTGDGTRGSGKAPGARILVLLPMNACRQYDDYFLDEVTYEGNWYLGTRNKARVTLADIRAAIRSVCDDFSVQCLDLNELAQVNRGNLMNVLGDGLHPTKEGHVGIGRALAAYIR